MRHSTPATARVMTPPGERWLARRVESLLGRLPPAAGAPVWIVRVPELRDRRGAVHAGSFLRQRRMVIACTRAEFPRVFVHEWFHFVWRRAGNPLRREYCCESFCDTAAWLYAGAASHAEFTLALRFRRRRQAWFAQNIAGKRLSI